MKQTLLALFCILSASTFAQKQNADNRLVGLDTTFARVLKDWHAAGFAVAVVEKDKVVYAKGFGYKDYENKIPVTTHTQFAIASCTKAFTASLLGLLRKDGKVDFDVPVTNYLPKLKFYNNQLNNYVTLRDMMSHRTGLPRHDYSWYLWPTNSVDSLISRIQYFEPFAGLREKWRYNNWMYFLQGAVIAKITGKTWEDNIREKIFKPLGMTESNLSIEERITNPNAALGYELKDDSIIYKIPFYNMAGMAPVGGISSTVNDMAKWLTVWINEGKYKGKEILPASYINEAKSSQMVIGAALPKNKNDDSYFSNYGFAWSLSSYRGHYRVEHGGHIDGFSTSTCFFPSDSIGIIVLVNQDNSPVNSVVRNILTDRMLRLKRKDWQTINKTASDERKQIALKREKNITSNKQKETHPSHDLKNYAGIYNNPGYGNIKVALKNDSLFGEAGKFKMWYKHFHYDVFESHLKDKNGEIDTSNSWKKFMFNMNKAGNIVSVSVDLEPSVKPIIFTKKPSIQELSKHLVNQYIGEYDMGGTIFQVYMKGDSTLTFFVAGQPEYELLSIAKDEFAIKSLPNYIVEFIRNDDNKVIALLSKQPNGIFKALKKK